MTDVPSNSTLRLTLGASTAGQRMDKAIASMTELSRSRIQSLMKEGHIILLSGNDRKTIDNPSQTVKPEDVCEVHIPEAAPAVPKAEKIPLDILYEDEAVIVINKPAGLVVHPAAGHKEGTLVNALLYHCGDSLSGIGGIKRPGIVHRLDKDTSGVMIAAKTDQAHQDMAKQFEEHTIERVYHALVKGLPAPTSGRIEGNIGRHPHDRKRMTVVEQGGKPAATNYKVLEVFECGKRAPLASLVECCLETGRTHQVRVHMAHIGHPLIGDPVYSRKISGKRASDDIISVLNSLERQALHAVSLGFQHPVTKKPLKFTTNYPHDMFQLISQLRERC